jgi:hypothetical protein
MKTHSICILSLKKLRTVTTLLIFTAFALMQSVANAQGSYWDAENPGYPGYLNLTGNNVVVTNGTVYALAFTTEISPDTSFVLMQWTKCAGWSIAAGFSGEDAGGATLCLGSSNLYIGGAFETAYPAPGSLLPSVNVTNIASYNLNTGSLSSVGDAAQFQYFPVFAIAVDSNQKVYIGTVPTNRTVLQTNMVMSLEEGVWTTVGNGVLLGELETDAGPEGVSAMTASGTNIYVAGLLDGGVNTDNTAMYSTNFIKWDGTTWQQMGSNGSIWYPGWRGEDYYIKSIATSGTNVFVAGSFTGLIAYVASAPVGVAQFSSDGTWIDSSSSELLDPFGGGCYPGQGFSLAVQNGTIYLGGIFDSIGSDTTCDGVSTANVACWTNGAWEALDSGISGLVGFLAADSNAVYVFGYFPGSFDEAGGIACTNGSGARWVTGPSNLVDQCVTPAAFVTIGYGTATSAYSADGIHWSASTMPSAQSWGSVAYGNGDFVNGDFVALIQDSTNLAYSANGINWTNSPQGMPVSANWISIAYGNGVFVACAQLSANAAYSADGTHWSASPTGMPASSKWTRLTYGNGVFAGIGHGSTAAYSTDGIHWSAASMPSSGSWSGLAYGNGVFVAVIQDSSDAAYSTNGINWTACSMPSSQNWIGPAYGNGLFVSIAQNSTDTAYSADGISWTAGPTGMPSAAQWENVAYGSGVFAAVAYGSTTAAYSTDGIDWSGSTLPANTYWDPVAASQ